MATYCIGDLHGRYDLFLMLLTKIQFNPKKDHIYLLGDLINKSYGGIKIIEFVMENSNSIEVLKGNHENHFLNMQHCYDHIMYNWHIRNAVKNVVNVYSKLFEEIADAFCKCIEKKTRKSFYESSKIKEWLKTGKNKVRTNLLERMIELVETINYDVKIYKDVYRVLSNMNGQFKTKRFVEEIIEIPLNKYSDIISFLKNTKEKISFVLNKKQFILTHSINQVISSYASRKLSFPHADTQKNYYIFGHTPIPELHRYIGFPPKDELTDHNHFDFDYKKIFSYIDNNSNHYYNLDTASNPIVALRLEDMAEFYIGLPSNHSSWCVPNDVLLIDNNCCYQQIDNALFYTEDNRRICFTKNGRNKVSFVTLKDNCYEYLIGIYKAKKQILYTRIDWLDYHHSFVIKNWYQEQTISEIIEKVREDYAERLKTPQILKIDNLLRGIIIE